MLQKSAAVLASGKRSDLSLGGKKQGTGRLSFRQWDPEPGLYYYRARSYPQTLGRFMQQDPIGFDGGDLNWIRYATGDPVRWSDAVGLRPSVGGSGRPTRVRRIFPGPRPGPDGTAPPIYQAPQQLSPTRPVIDFIGDVISTALGSGSQANHRAAWRLCSDELKLIAFEELHCYKCCIVNTTSLGVPQSARLSQESCEGNNAMGYIHNSNTWVITLALRRNEWVKTD